MRPANHLPPFRQAQVNAYLDCFAGASGDMILGAFVDSGADLEEIGKQVSTVLGPVELSAVTVHRCGIRATQVRIEESPTCLLRTYADARRLLAGTNLEPNVAARARLILERLVEAEARVHGTPMEEVELHEVGGADTIIDTVGVAAAIRLLGIRRLTASPVATGKGMAATHHGPLPLPAPAALELLRGAPVYMRDIEAELVTPTGAAILAVCAHSYGEMPLMTVRSVGYGAGSRELPIPNVLRVVLGDAPVNAPEAVEELLVEATIDDMNPELYTYVTERLFEAGANDVWVAPVIGKRGRPANVLSVLLSPAREAAIRAVLITETSTIGGRTTRVDKWMLERDWMEVTVDGRSIRVKVARQGGLVVNIAPEYADCAEVARATGLPLKEVFQVAVRRASERVM